jgi:hypothetical protein
MHFPRHTNIIPEDAGWLDTFSSIAAPKRTTAAASNFYLVRTITHSRYGNPT